MPIQDFQKLQILWKRTNFGVAQTSTNKDAYEENERSPLAIFGTDIWRDDGSIPATAAASDGIVEVVDGVMYRDVTNSGYTAYAAYKSAIRDEENRIRDFIPTSKGVGYQIRIYRDLTKTDEIEPNDPTNEWYFDYSSGVLWIPDNQDTLENLYITGFQYVGRKGVNTITGDPSDYLKDPSSGSYVGGYVPNIVAEVTTIADAVDKMNRAMNDFRPPAPPALSEYNIVIPGLSKTVSDAEIVLAKNYVGNAIIGSPAPGTSIARIYGTKLESETVGPFGSGNSGTLTVLLNNTIQSGTTLTPGSNIGTYGSLQILTDETFPENSAPFYEAITVRLASLPVMDGLNILRLNHTQTGATPDVLYYREDDKTLPSVTSFDFALGIKDTVLYSSGVPHYGRGTTIAINASAANLATNLALKSKQIVFDTVPNVAPPVWTVAGRNGMPSVLEKGLGYSVENVILTFDDEDAINAAGTVEVVAYANNANGRSAQLASPKKLNIMRGNEMDMLANPVKEAGVPIINVGKLVDGAPIMATRIVQGATKTPEWSYGFQLPNDFDSTQLKQVYDAGIIGGRIIASKIDYRSYLPAGPDYTIHEDIQYATFAIRRANVQEFAIEIEGTYNSLNVSLPGVSMPLVVNNWLDAFDSYTGVGTPGVDDLGGCAIGTPATGGTQKIHVTFGRESSNNSYNNLILVRIGVAQGQAVTGLRFVGI